MVSSSSIALPANKPALILEPPVSGRLSINCVTVSFVVSVNSVKSSLVTSPRNCTAPILTVASEFLTCVYNSLNIFATSAFTGSLQLDSSKTNTTSVTNFSSADGNDNVTFDSKFSSKLVAVLERETSHLDSGIVGGTSASNSGNLCAAFKASFSSVLAIASVYSSV